MQKLNRPWIKNRLMASQPSFLTSTNAAFITDIMSRDKEPLLDVRAAVFDNNPHGLTWLENGLFYDEYCEYRRLLACCENDTIPQHIIWPGFLGF
jgi:hypothetical protein